MIDDLITQGKILYAGERVECRRLKRPLLCRSLPLDRIVVNQPQRTTS